MAESSAAPGAKPSGNEASADPDTCRICRGEGTADEPLFYPCKCSGSIKYVHQDCLMEWLSHSQKKHCELCKTPFRFTKLYSPDMPKRLPFHIFITHMAKYIFRNVLVWLRAILVISVWLGWLPYLMRSVWSFLFWISDEGFGPGPPSFDSRNATSIGRGDLASLSVVGATTCASTPLLPVTTTAASIGSVIEQIPVSNLLKAISKPLNTTPSSWLALLFGLPTTVDKSAMGARDLLNATHINQITISPSASRPTSLLSEVAILKNFTRHPAVNRTIIAVLEGQIITLLVIVCFILIILVRDYVVQQQPEINMRAAFAAAENEAPPLVGPVMNPAPRNPAQDDDDDTDSDDDSSVHGQDGSAVTGRTGREDVNQPMFPPDIVDLHDPRQRPIAEFRRRATRFDAEPGQDRWPGERERGPLTVRNAVVPASDEESLMEQDERGPHGPLLSSVATIDLNDGELTPQSTVKEYLRIYRDNDGDPEKILQTIQDEGLEDRMRYWVRVTQSMATAGRAGGAADPHPENDAGSSRPIQFEPQSGQFLNRPDSPKADGTSSDTSSWTWSEPDDREAATSQGSHGKGKNKATESFTHDQDSWTTWGGEFGEGPSRSADIGVGGENGGDKPFTFESAMTRPRSASDGPQAPRKINLLANNNWSFSDLPPDPPEAPHEEKSRPEDPVDFNPTLHPAPLVENSHDDLENAVLLGPNVPGDDRRGTEGETHGPRENDQGENPAGVIGHVHDMEHAAAPARRAGGIVDRVADFMWGNVEAVPADDLEPEDAVDIFGDNQNAPFFANDREDDGEDDDEVEMAPDVVEAAVAAGIDPEAVEDAEDFEGIMELIGMRGPVAGLFQNAIFCAFLVSISIFFCIFVPYNAGRVSVWVIANPTRLLRIVVSVSKFVQDGALFLVGYTSRMVFNLVEALRLLFGIKQGEHLIHILRTDSKDISLEALDRILSSFMSEMPLISVSEVRNFSAVSHEALATVKDDIRIAFSSIGHIALYLFGGNYLTKWVTAKTLISALGPVTLEFLRSVSSMATQPGSWMLNLNLSEPASPLNPTLAYWDANDRTWAILLGYTSLCVMAGLYLARGTPFSSGQGTQEWEASIIDALNQASGVMKVILIISIEMLIFPLYCGLLLDFALLPLFEGTTIRSRLLFTYNYPLTSIFVHWFVGTGYMFHFALFVSMCRKIMRKGVLYFIRDPDDPEFHPVRDVLERNVATQLRKILFSAFVYGALVVVCLGGVVWGLSLALPNVLPIHYSSNEPVLEFPIDLLFYNFLMPLAVRFFKPSDGLHTMYTWWFRKCARGLRITWFLFGERRIDEEGTLALPKDSPYLNTPWWSRFFLEVNYNNEVVPNTWEDIFRGGRSKPVSRIVPEQMMIYDAKKKQLVASGQLIPSGHFVRSPASDQVKIPKGHPVFLNVTEEDVRTDGNQDWSHSDIYMVDNHYQFVYVPPWFRVRIFLFILSIWIFAAVTGVGFTIVPLVFGRRMFKVLIPAHIRTNDIYAFSIGIYILGSLGYFLFHLQSMLSKMNAWAASTVDSMLDRHTIQRSLHFAARACRLLYTYITLLVVFPLLITLLVELYLLMPLHTYMYPTSLGVTRRIDGIREGHTIRVIQAWTLGILYLKLGSRAVTLYGGRPAHAVRAVLQRGWLEPNVRVLTRAFVIPGVIVSLVMIVTPPVVTWIVLHRIMDVNATVTREMRVMMFRLAYPTTALFWAGLLMTRRMLRVFEGWQVRIRDEAYLMGERLHNFGGTAGKVTSWRGSTRL
ncbi:hypothetical protein M426DRAFT_73116 [Hypoxylon sp. CI-4A]|nr:hypothetical protein M426DRAFT_73116 [Hypoxylon sp. CI-4A]